MSDEQGEFSVWINQVRNGSEEAAWRLIEVYGGHVLKVVRRSLNHRLRPKFDSHDFVQAVWKSFFRDRDQVLSLQTPQQFVAFLTAVARNKVIDESRRRLHTAKYDVTREEGLESAPLDRAPRPSEVAVARETWDRIMARQSSEHQRVIELRFQGHTFDEIAAKLGISERTARRVVARLLECELA